MPFKPLMVRGAFVATLKSSPKKALPGLRSLPLKSIGIVRPSRKYDFK
jgi:hypothetical protein